MPAFANVGRISPGATPTAPAPRRSRQLLMSLAALGRQALTTIARDLPAAFTQS